MKHMLALLAASLLSGAAAAGDVFVKDGGWESVTTATAPAATSQLEDKSVQYYGVPDVRFSFVSAGGFAEMLRDDYESRHPRISGRDAEMAYYGR